MNKKVLIGSLLVIGFIIMTIFQFSENETMVTYLDEAQETGKTVQIIGYWQKDMETKYESGDHKFHFYMKDEKEILTKVVLEGAKPPNFEMAEKVFVKGQHNGDFFHATEVLTKCPSKYEGKGEHPGNVNV
jgi:cytochrome c-type biogenesis protein CcmE